MPLEIFLIFTDYNCSTIVLLIIKSWSYILIKIFFFVRQVINEKKAIYWNEIWLSICQYGSSG